MSSIYSGSLKLTLFGQSHSTDIGCVLDGLPAGIPVDIDALRRFMRRRAPGLAEWSTKRCEADEPEIVSGLFEGRTCGAPLCVVVRNGDARPGDYAALRDVARPGHADYTAHLRYDGFEDATGGGHLSGRLTAALCAAGGICAQALALRGVRIAAHLLSVGGVADTAFPETGFIETCADKPFPALSDLAGEAMREAIRAAASEGDSLGGVIECMATGVPGGLGDPVFDGMENRIARLVFAVPGVKGLEFGAGFEAARMRGSENNDAFINRDGQVRTETNNCGGLLGGITNGMPVCFRAAIKPTPSISRPQRSVRLSDGCETVLRVGGRHDPCFAPRAVPCMEAALAIALMDALVEREGIAAWR